MPARTGCCHVCCKCTVKDVALADADGVLVEESFTTGGIQDNTESSDQDSDHGGTHRCNAIVIAEQPPCREIRLAWTQTRSNVIDHRIGVTITVTGTNTLPGVPGSTWSGAYNLILGVGEYLGTNASTMSCQITGSGTTLSVHFYAGALEGAVYRATLSDATLPLDVGRTEPAIVASLFSQHDPGLTWPATVTLVPSLPYRQGEEHGSVWWRFYSGVTFTPDGETDPHIALCYESSGVSASATSELDGVTNTAGAPFDAKLLLAAKQGSDLFIAAVALEGINGPDSGWYYHGGDLRLLSLIGWYRYTGTPDTLERESAELDVADGADPITFGIAWAGGSGGTSGVQTFSGSFRDIDVTMRIDNVCLRLEGAN